MSRLTTQVNLRITFGELLNLTLTDRMLSISKKKKIVTRKQRRHLQLTDCYPHSNSPSIRRTWRRIFQHKSAQGRICGNEGNGQGAKEAGLTLLKSDCANGSSRERTAVIPASSRRVRSAWYGCLRHAPFFSRFAPPSSGQRRISSASCKLE
jgi:hypothetical protein